MSEKQSSIELGEQLDRRDDIASLLSLRPSHAELLQFLGIEKQYARTGAFRATTGGDELIAA